MRTKTRDLQEVLDDYREVSLELCDLLKRTGHEEDLAECATIMAGVYELEERHL